MHPKCYSFMLSLLLGLRGVDPRRRHRGRGARRALGAAPEDEGMVVEGHDEGAAATAEL